MIDSIVSEYFVPNYDHWGQLGWIWTGLFSLQMAHHEGLDCSPTTRGPWSCNRDFARTPLDLGGAAQEWGWNNFQIQVSKDTNYGQFHTTSFIPSRVASRGMLLNMNPWTKQHWLSRLARHWRKIGKLFFPKSEASKKTCFFVLIFSITDGSMRRMRRRGEPRAGHRPLEWRSQASEWARIERQNFHLCASNCFQALHLS